MLVFGREPQRDHPGAPDRPAVPEEAEKAEGEEPPVRDISWGLLNSPSNIRMTGISFVTRERGVRAVKDAISREVLAGLEAAGIAVASATFEMTGLPTVRVEGDVTRGQGHERA